MPDTTAAPVQSLAVFRARDVSCTNGANMGDALSFAAELVLDDIYELPMGSTPQRLSLLPLADTSFQIAPETDVGTPGTALHLDCALSFMAPDGGTHDALVLVEVDAAGGVIDIYLLPLTTLTPRSEYRLIGIDTTTARQKFAQVACVSFTRGTHITLATGEQRLIEDLKIGDRILTRDDGAQPIRWIGHATVRAVGDFAPIKIAKGTLNNEHDLIVSPDHRLFIYQRSDEVGAGRAELLVKARHLVNGQSVTCMDGGFVDYVQLLFDSHQIIFAEGIAAETMLIDMRTKSMLPEDLSVEMGTVIPGHTDQPHAGLDVNEALLNRPDAADMLRKASTR